MDFTKTPYWDIFKGFTLDFGQKLEISCLFLDKISYEIIFDNQI